MKREYSRPYVIRYTLLAFVIGLVFLLLGLFIGLLMISSTLTLQDIVDFHKTTPILYYFNLIPFFAAVVVFFVARNQSMLQTKVENSVQEESSRKQNLYNFVESLCEGKIDVEYVPEENDILGKSVVELRDYIATSKRDEQIRRNEDEQRGWVAEGLAKFGEILRLNNDNIEELSYQIVLNLVKYVNANQGAFYILEDSEKDNVFFRMTACYAYERKKYADKIIPWGDGLVGACALERQIIYMKNVRDSYLQITSGLGKANPRGVLLTPLLMNDNVYGVIELASFNVFEQYQLDFIKKVTESIATTISTVKINLITAKLLTESRLQAEELALKEQQMRQNMEELQATQEEASRQSEKFISFTNSVNHTLIRANFDVYGNLIYANTKFLQKLEYESNSEVEGKPLSMFINKKDRVWFDNIWYGLSKGGKHFEGDIKMLSKTGKDIWMMSTFTCVRTAEEGVDNILFLAIDTTDKKKQSLDYEGQILALNRSNIKVEFSPTADIIEANEHFLHAMGYHDIGYKTLFDMVVSTERVNVEQLWDDIIHGIPYEGQLNFITKNKEMKWLRCTFTAVNDMYDEVAKVILIANDINREKLMEIESVEQTKILKKQEEQLRMNEIVLNKKLKEAREEVKSQFKEVEKVKIRNEKTLEGFLDAIITTDHDGVVQFFNVAAEQLFGVDRSDILNQNIRILFPDYVDGSNEFLDLFLGHSDEKIIGQRKEITIKTHDGEEVPVLILLSEARIGREVSYTAFIQNISVELF